MSESSTISDQEAEVAEALFVLARSTPSHTGIIEPKLEAKHEVEEKSVSPAEVTPTSTAIAHNSSAGLGNASNGHARDSAKPTAEGMGSS